MQCNTNNIFSAFVEVIGQCRRIFLLWCLFLKVYSPTDSVVIKCTVL